MHFRSRYLSKFQIKLKQNKLKQNNYWANLRFSLRDIHSQDSLILGKIYENKRACSSFIQSRGVIFKNIKILENI